MKKIFFVLMLAINAQAHSANVPTSYFAAYSVRISDSSGNGFIDPVGNVESINTSCSQTGMYAFSKDDELFNQMYSAALTALVSGREIRVWVSDAANDCVLNYQRVRIIEIK